MSWHARLVSESKHLQLLLHISIHANAYLGKVNWLTIVFLLFHFSVPIRCLLYFWSSLQNLFILTVNWYKLLSVKECFLLLIWSDFFLLRICNLCIDALKRNFSSINRGVFSSDLAEFLESWETFFFGSSEDLDAQFEVL